MLDYAKSAITTCPPNSISLPSNHFRKYFQPVRNQPLLLFGQEFMGSSIRGRNR